MKKSFKYRVYANKQTIQNTQHWLDLCRTLYNTFLECKIIKYKTFKKYLSCYEQMRHLTHLKKTFPEFKVVNSQTLQDVIEKLEKAYRSFFRRVKNGDKPGFPRFKTFNRYNSFTLIQHGWKLQGKYLVIRNVGKFKLKLHRPIEGTIKTVTIKKTTTNKWFIIFSCDNVPQQILPKTHKSVGIDVGCESFLTTSNNVKIPNPRLFKRSRELLTKRQQALSSKKKGSTRRSEAKILVAKAHEKVSNQRRDFHFKIANHLVRENDLICIEKMNSWNSFRTLTRSMRDVAWFQFFDILRFKAEEAGKEVVEVPAKNTSQLCSQCGKRVPKDLSVRVHSCSCGLNIDRDYNAALNILRLGLSLQAQVLLLA